MPHFEPPGFHGPFSALSEPKNFIAEGPLRRMLRRNGQMLWPIATAVTVMVSGGILLSGARFSADPPATSPSTTVQKTDMRKPENPDASQGVQKLREEMEASQPKPVKALWTADDFRPVRSSEAPAPVKMSDLPAPAPEAPKQAEAKAEPPPPTETSSVAPMKPAETAKPTAQADDLLGRADEHLRHGQVVVARAFYKESFAKGNVYGALGMARSFDPKYLRSINSGSKGDWQKSRNWYRKAAELGVATKGDAKP